jgi:hypothetical protein
MKGERLARGSGGCIIIYFLIFYGGDKGGYHEGYVVFLLWVVGELRGLIKA